MPRYYFDLFNDVTARDEEGRELPDNAAALQIAAGEAREIAAHGVLKGHLVLDDRIEVRNDIGDPVGTVQFGDVIEIRPSVAAG